MDVKKNKKIWVCSTGVILLYTFLVCMMESCVERRKDDAPAEAASAVDVVRLEGEISRYASLDSSSRARLLDSLGDALNVVLKMNGYDGVSDSSMMEYSKSAPVEIFTPDVIKVYPEDSDLAQTIGDVASGVKSILPGVDVKEIYTIVSPFNQSIVLSDSMIFVALNHYLGEDYPGYAGRFQDYQRRVKTEAALPYQLAEALIASAYPYEGANVSHRLMYEGALAAASEAVVPHSKEGEALCYSDAEMEWAMTNEADIWRTLIGKDMYFSTSPVDEARLFGLSPHTSVISPQSPGRLGRFVGYRMVKSYLKNHPDTSWEEMLKPEFYTNPETAGLCGYSPA